MNKKRLLLWIGVILIFLTTFNLLIYINRKDLGLQYTPASYSSIYYPSEIPKITGFDLLPADKLRIKIIIQGKKCKEWKIIRNDEPFYIHNGAYPELDLLKGKNGYKIMPHGNKEIAIEPIIVKIHYRHEPSPLYHAFYSNIPIGNIKQYSLDSWADAFYDINTDELEKVKKIIKQEINVRDADDTLLKIEKIFGYLMSNFDLKRGARCKKIEDASLSLFKVYSIASTETTGLYCSEFAKIYVLFANAAGIPTRLVQSGGHIGKVKLSTPVFSESFIKEQNRWALVDLHSRKCYVSDVNGMVLNAIDLFNITLLGAQSAYYAKIFRQGEVITAPYSMACESEKYYFSKDAEFKFMFKANKRYSLLKRIYRYLIQPDLTYSNIAVVSSARQYIKLFLLYGWILFFLTWCFLAISCKNEPD
ncbi:MAG: transglutaminase domain-containing protein [Candidatus Omnitrophica bacterium]|nr:transglutaminase domain-containing protein [Candidatus Omnitrophota bacterium]